MSGLALTPVAGTTGAWQPTFAPDGRKVAFFADRKLKTVALGGGPVETLAEIGGNPRGASWGEDGTIVVSPAQGKGLVRVNARGGAAAAGPHASSTRRRARSPIAGRRRCPEAASSCSPWPSRTRTTTRRGSRWPRSRPESGESSSTEALTAGTCRPATSSSPAGGGFSRCPSISRPSRFAAVPPWSWKASATTLGTAAPTWRSRRAAPWCTDTAPRPPATTAWPGWTRRGRSARSPDTPRAFRELRLSPDARRVALVIGRGADSDLWLMDLQSGTLSQLTFGLRPRRPIWTPDGRKITIAVPAGSGWKLALVGRDGGAPVTLLERKTRVYPNVWTSDGRTLLYQERRPGSGLGPPRRGRRTKRARSRRHGRSWSRRSTKPTPTSLPTGASWPTSPTSSTTCSRCTCGRSRAASRCGPRPPEPAGRASARPASSSTGTASRASCASSTTAPSATAWWPDRGDPCSKAPRARGSDRIMVRASYESYDLDVPRQRILVLERAAAPAPLLTRPAVVLNWADELRALSPSLTRTSAGGSYLRMT